MKMTPEELKKDGFCPCIIHWNMNHFVVLKGFRGDKVYINDPARGSVKISWEEFDESFTGIVIFPLPSKDFKPEGKPKSMWKFAAKNLSGAGAALTFVIYPGPAEDKVPHQSFPTMSFIAPPYGDLP